MVLRNATGDELFAAHASLIGGGGAEERVMPPARGLATVALAMLLLLGVGALIARKTTVTPPSPAECVSLWSSATNTASQRRAAASSGRLVVVDGSTNKASQRGCAVTVLAGAGEPWVSFSTTVDQLQQFPGMWFLESGARWGTDSPEPEKPPNATLRPDGTVVLDART
jgi:hypothetical protein